MKIWKKITSGITTLTLMLSLMTFIPSVNAYQDVKASDWYEPYTSFLSEIGVIDGSKAYYNPSHNVTNAEALKMAINSSEISLQSWSFSKNIKDVKSGDWFYPYYITADKTWIHDTYMNGFYLPNLPKTRGDVLHLFNTSFLGEGIASSTSATNPFPDLSEQHPFYDDIMFAYELGIINGDNKGKIRANDPVNRAEMAKITTNYIQILGNETSTPDDESNTDEETNDDSSDDWNDSSDDENSEETDNDSGNTTSNENVQISISAENPEGRSVPKNGFNVEFLVLDVTAPSDSDMKITEIRVTRSGLGNDEEIGSVKAFDGFTQVGSDRSFNDDDEALLNLKNEPFEVPAGETKTLTIVGDIDADTSGGEHRFSIKEPEDIVIIDSDTNEELSVEADFPIRGNTMRVTSLEVGHLDFELKSVSDDQVEVGETGVELAVLEIEETTSGEDVLLKAMTLEFDGMDDGDITNIYAEFQGSAITEKLEKTKSNSGTLDFTKDGTEDGWLIGDGDTKTIRIKGDIVGGVDETLKVSFDNIEADVVAIGDKYGFGVKLSNSGITGWDPIEILGGDINFTFNSSSKDVPKDSDNVEFGTLTIDNNGEAIELEEFDLVLVVETGGNAKDIQDVRLVEDTDDERGDVMWPEDPSTSLADNVDATISFNDSVVIEENEKKTFKLMADIDSSAANSAEYYFKLDMSTVTVKGIESRETSVGGNQAEQQSHDIKPTGDPETQIFTIATPSVTFTKKTLGSDTYVEKAEDAIVWWGTVRASDVKDVVIRRIEFVQEGDATDSDIDDFSIYKLEDNKDFDDDKQIVESGEDLDGDRVSFSNLNEDGNQGLYIDKGDEIEIILTADIASNVSNPWSKIQMTLDVSELSVEDEDGDAATFTNQSDLTSSEFTLQSNGQLVVELDNSNTPDSAIVIAGEEVVVATYDFESRNENVLVKDLTVHFVNQSEESTKITPENVEIGDVFTVKLRNSTGTVSTVSFTATAATVANVTAGLQPLLDAISNITAVDNTTDVEITATGDSYFTVSSYATNVTAGTDDQELTNDTDFGMITDDISRIIDSVSLYYHEEDDPVEKTNGNKAKVSAIDEDGKAFFQDLDMKIEDGEDQLIDVKVTLREMDKSGSNGTSRSGIAFSTLLSFVGSDAEIRGEDSGDLLADEDVIIESDDEDDSDDDVTSTSDIMYIFNNRLIAELTSSQTSTLVSGTKRELLKFTLDIEGDTDDSPFLKEVIAEINGTGQACVSEDSDCDTVDGEVYLLNGDNEIVAVGELISGTQRSGTWRFTVGNDNGSDVTLSDEFFEFPYAGSGEFYEELDSRGETFKIQADLYTDGNDDAINTSIEINSSAPFTENDGITWRDGGSDGGIDGAVVKWIDLGEDKSSTSEIENRLDN